MGAGCAFVQGSETNSAVMGGGLMAAVREAGREGERQAGVDPNKPKERVESRTGAAKYRIPDESDQSTVKETKNVKELKVTNQLKDFAKEAQASERAFTLKLRENTKIGPAAQRFIQENGVKVERPIAAPGTVPNGMGRLPGVLGVIMLMEQTIMMAIDASSDPDPCSMEPGCA